MENKILNGVGKIYDENISIVHFKLKKGEQIKKHNHIGKNIFFNIFNGKMEVNINDDKYIVNQNEILNFDGSKYISAEALEDSDVFIYLV